MSKTFYEKFYSNFKRDKLEQLKQNTRLKVIRRLAEKNKLPDKKILICGCGLGEDTSVFDKRLVAIDLSFVAVKNAKQNFTGNIFLVADAINLPFIDSSFDCIVCSEVIEHIPNPKEMLYEFNRVLRPEGELIISVPNWISWFGLARKIGEFILRRPLTAAGQPLDNWYTAGSLRNLIESYFEILEWRGIWYYPPCGRGKSVIPDFFILPLFRLFQPLDIFLGKFSPTIGSHILAVRCKALPKKC